MDIKAIRDEQRFLIGHMADLGREQARIQKAMLADQERMEHLRRMAYELGYET